jgi:hypothetical protein
MIKMPKTGERVLFYPRDWFEKYDYEAPRNKKDKCPMFQGNMDKVIDGKFHEVVRGGKTWFGVAGFDFKYEPWMVEKCFGPIKATRKMETDRGVGSHND